MAENCNGITINTISGGIVNFGGAFKIAPISITKSTTTGTSPSTSSGTVIPSSITGTLGALGAGALGGGSLAGGTSNLPA